MIIRAYIHNLNNEYKNIAFREYKAYIPEYV